MRYCYIKCKKVLFSFLTGVWAVYCFSGCIPDSYSEEDVTCFYVNPDDIPSVSVLARNGEIDLLKKLWKMEPEVIKKDAPQCLMEAIETGKTEVVKFLVFKVMDVNAPTIYYHSPLLYAMEKGKTEMAVLLIKLGAKAENPDDYHTPFYLAVQEGDLEIMGLLLKKGANVNTGYIPPLHAAIQEGNKELVPLLVELGADVDAVRGDDGTPALCIAAKKNDLESVLFLLEKGADINKTGGKGLTALHYATEWGNLEMIEQLIKYKADINAETEEYGLGRITPLWVAAWKGDMTIVRFLMQQETIRVDNPLLLAGAAYGGSREAFTYLLDKVPELTPEQWKEIWERALSGDNVDIVRYILERTGIDVNEGIGDSHYLPLQLVLWNWRKEGERVQKNKQLTDYLLDQGANPLLINQGELLEWMVGNSNQESMDYFWEKGYRFQKDPFRSLQVALRDGNFDVARYLLQQTGYDPLVLGTYLPDYPYLPAYPYLPLILYYASYYATQYEWDDMAPILEFLIEEKVNTDYFTPAFFQCVRWSDLQSAIHFLRHGMDINVKDEQGLNALWYVLDSEVAEYLILHGIDTSISLMHGEEVIDIAVLSTFEKYGIPISLPQQGLDKALGKAALTGNDKMVDYLIRKGANIEGSGALHENAKIGYEKYSYDRKVSSRVMQLLIQAGANVDMVNKNGETALQLVLENYFYYINRNRFRTRYDKISWYETEPDKYPRQNRSLQAIELIKAGADVNRVNKKGYTPLLQAIENDYENLIPLLLKYGADVNYQTESGITPLELARQKCTKRTIWLLEKAINK